MAFVKSTEECWLWQGSLYDNGYGRFCPGGRSKNMRAHRFSYEHFNGPIPDGLQIDHTCEERACVNPAHLEAVTGQENIIRGHTRRSSK